MNSDTFFRINTGMLIVGGLFAIVILLFLIYAKIGDKKKSKA